MRVLFAALAVAVLLAMVSGCARKSEEQTSAVPVENPVVKGEEFTASPGHEGHEHAEEAPVPSPAEPAVEPRRDTKGFTKTRSGLMYKTSRSARAPRRRPETGLRSTTRAGWKTARCSTARSGPAGSRSHSISAGAK